MNLEKKLHKLHKKIKSIFSSDTRMFKNKNKIEKKNFVNLPFKLIYDTKHDKHQSSLCS